MMLLFKTLDKDKVEEMSKEMNEIMIKEIEYNYDIYKVYTSIAEIKRYRSYDKENNNIEKKNDSMMLPFKPLAQTKVDEISEEMNENMMKEIEFIYDFGTDETREKLKEMGFNK